MTHAQVLPDAFFMEGVQGACFCLFHQPSAGQPVRGGLLCIHPFAEEMNLSRRTMAAQARAFASQGFAVLQIDLYGCGDSAGDFADATWDTWCNDVARAQDWLAARVVAPLWLWGLRSGCFVAAEVARRQVPTPAHLLFWQPVFSGQQHFNQFLRLSLAADLARGVRVANTGHLAQKLLHGEFVEVAGYRLSPRLAHGLSLATLEGLAAGTRVVCLEMARTAAADVSPALAAQLARWQAVGCRATAAAIEGPAFWQVAEAPVCQALLQASLAAVLQPVQQSAWEAA